MKYQSKILRLFKYFQTVIKGALFKPSTLVIELTNNCNASCIMCGHDSISRKRMYMDFSLFQKIILEAKKNKINTFQLSFYGEPLLYPRLVEAIHFIKENITESVIQISTNAALLNKQFSKQLIEAGLSRFLISIDGNNATEFEKIRVGLKWDDVKKNVKDLHELIVSENHPVEVHLRGLYLKGFPLDSTLYNKEWGIYADCIHIRNDHDLNRITKENIIHKILPCELLFTQQVIMVDGTVTVCNQDWEGEMSYDKFPDHNLKQLWKATKLVRMRIFHVIGLKKTIPYCNKCTHRVF